MRLILPGVTYGTLLLSAVVYAQVPSPVHEPTPPIGHVPSQDQAVQATGCIQRESDYRRVRQSARGITVIGTADNFVLIHAAVSVTGSPIAGTKAEVVREPPGSTIGVSYQLIGPRKNDVATFIDHWVEIVGTLREPPQVTEPVANVMLDRAPQVADVTTRALGLRQIEVDSVRELRAACTGP